MNLVDVWPVFGIRIRTPRLVLRTPTDADLGELLDVVTTGVHDPATTPFVVPWTDCESPKREQEALKYWWGCRSGFGLEAWDLPFAVEFEGRLVGVQNLSAKQFVQRRTAETGSWLGLEFQGLGIGTEMRKAALYFAFERLGALSVTSQAFVDNEASKRVSLAAGYVPNGFTHALRRGMRSEQAEFVITADRWAEVSGRQEFGADGIEVEGLEACLPMFGVGEA